MAHITPELAVRTEADVRQRAGQITHSQALALVRNGKADPLATMALHQTVQANRLAAALRELYSVCVAMDIEIEGERPTEDEYQAAMREAEAALAAY